MTKNDKTGSFCCCRLFLFSCPVCHKSLQSHFIASFGPKTVSHFFFTLLFFPSSEPPGKCRITQANREYTQQTRKSAALSVHQYDKYEMDLQLCMGQHSLQEVLLSVLPGTHIAIGVAVDSKNILQTTELYTSKLSVRFISYFTLFYFTYWQILWTY